MQITKIIKSVMRDKGITQAILANKMGLKQASISDMLLGKRKLYIQDVVMIAKFLGCEKELAENLFNLSNLSKPNPESELIGRREKLCKKILEIDEKLKKNMQT